jgi:hypothetical protein
MFPFLSKHGYRRFSGSLRVGLGLAWAIVGAVVFFAGLSPVQAATCGKHFLVLSPGMKGALVDAVVARHHKNISRHEAATTRRLPGENLPFSHPYRVPCDAPQCRGDEPAPSVPTTPVPTTSTSTVVKFALIDSATCSLSLHVRKYVTEAGLLYDLEPAPPPTPPPNLV